MSELRESGRGEQLLRGSCIAGLALIAAACGVIFAVHESADVEVGRWSWRYIYGSVLPITAVLAGQALLVLLPPRSRVLELVLALACVVAASLLIVIGVAVQRPYELPVLVFFLGLMALPLAGYRLYGGGQWLISFATVLLFCLVLFVPEAVFLARDGRIPGDHRLPRWGDPMTFRHLFPEAEPFTSAGGRLQPNLDLQVAARPGGPFYWVQTNSQGFRNSEETPRTKEAGEIRVLSLGDSFSTGFGVAQDRFLGPLLESSWRRQYPQRRITVLNAEVSDPAYGLLYLQRFGLDYSPDVVVYNYYCNDIHQAYLPFADRGIFSFDAQGQVQTKSISLEESWQRTKAAQLRFAQYLYPRLNPDRVGLGEALRHAALTWRAQLVQSLGEFHVLASFVRRPSAQPTGNDRAGDYSYVSFDGSHTDGHMRLIDFYADMGMLYRRGDAMTAPLYENLFRILASLKESAARRGAVFVLTYFPRREEVQPQDWANLRAFWNLDADDFDLDLERNRLKAFCEEHDIPFVDTTPALRAAAGEASLYLADDAHFNASGQAVAAQAILEALDAPMRRLAAPGARG